MSNQMKITYSMRTILNAEACVIMCDIKSRFSIKEGGKSMFLLTANSEENLNHDDEWAGFINSIKKFVNVENSALIQTISQLLKMKEAPLATVHTEETVRQCIKDA